MISSIARLNVTDNLWLALIGRLRNPSKYALFVTNTLAARSETLTALGPVKVRHLRTESQKSADNAERVLKLVCRKIPENITAAPNADMSLDKTELKLYAKIVKSHSRFNDGMLRMGEFIVLKNVQMKRYATE